MRISWLLELQKNHRQQKQPTNCFSWITYLIWWKTLHLATLSLDLPRVDDDGVGLSIVTPPWLDASPSLGVVAGVGADSLDDDPGVDADVCSLAGVFTVTSLPELFPSDDEFVVVSGCRASSEVVEPLTYKGFEITNFMMISASQKVIFFFLTLPETVGAAWLMKSFFELCLKVGWDVAVVLNMVFNTLWLVLWKYQPCIWIDYTFPNGINRGIR